MEVESDLSSAPPGPSEVTTVRHLVDAIGSPLLHVLAAPKGLDVRVRSTVLLDITETLGIEPDAMLLLSGLRGADPVSTETVRVAAANGFCAVILKRRGEEVSALVTAASIAGIAVLAADDEVSWRHLDALLQSVLGSQGMAAESASGAGDELFALANAIASVVGGSVAIEDLDRRIVAYSSLSEQRIDTLREKGILDRRVPDRHAHADQYRKLFATDGIVRFDETSDELARSAIAIRAGEQPLGSIWAIEGHQAMDEAADAALVEGARLAALKILRSLNSSDLELQLRESALVRALDGSLTNSEAAFRLSLPGGAELSLVGFAVCSGVNKTAPLITHVASALARYIAAYRPDAAMATTSRAVYVLLPGGGVVGSDRRSGKYPPIGLETKRGSAGSALSASTGVSGATRFATGALAATAETFPTQVRVGIAQSSLDPSDLPKMRLEIDDILRVTTLQPDLPVVAHLADVHTRVLLSHVQDQLTHTPRLRHPGVDRMLNHDNEHHTDYARSVTAWLDAIGDVGLAARELGIHTNTLRYRLRRATELFNLPMELPDDRLAVWMQLRLRRFAQ